MSYIKKIAIIVESIDVDDSSGSKVNVALIQNLSAIGYQVSVFHYTRKEIQLENIPCFSIKEKKGGLYLLSRFQRIIQRTFKINLSKPLENLFGFSFTFFNDSNSIKSFIADKITTCDLVFTLSKGASFRPHYALLKLPQFHNKWLAYIHDPYPFHCYPKPYDWFEPGYKQKKTFFREVSVKAKYSAFPSLLLKEWMGNYYPNFLKTGIVIPHQNIHFEKDSFNTSIDFFDKNKFNLLHAGNLMTARNPEGLILGFEIFLKNNVSAKKESYLILLGVSSIHRLKIKKHENEIDTLYFSDGYLPYDMVNYIQNNVSVNIILEAKSNISPFLPAKFSHCIQANKPLLVLGPYKSESRRLLGENYKYVSEIDDINRISKLIEELYYNWKHNKHIYLEREDLNFYLSLENLRKIMNSILSI